MPTAPNLRPELRAYEQIDSCRLASILQVLYQPTELVSRDEVREYWAELYPAHAIMTGKQAISRRVGRSLAYLSTSHIARAVEEPPQTIEVINADFLNMATGNLALVQDENGDARPFGSWGERLQVPDHLKEILAIRQQARQQPL